MTLERNAYLAKCSEWELEVRNWIKIQKQQLQLAKQGLRYGYDDEYYRHCLRKRKGYLMMYRHELNRLKGMNNVVVPRQVRMAAYPARHGFGFGYECVAIGLCACGAPLRDDECKYCQRCGKRVLWGKVK